ncbi:hypothetical protein CFP56_010718, partial [Quercus suber]
DFTINPSRLQVTFNFLNQLTSLDLSLCRRIQSLDELPIGLQAMDASNTTSLVWIFTRLNWELSKQLQCFGCSKVLKKNRTSNPKNKLLNELIATNSFSVFCPGGEFPDWFDALVVSKRSILSSVVPSLVKQEIRGWFLCAVFASSFHDIHGFTVSYKFKNRTKGIEWQCQQKNSRVIPCQEHIWLQFVSLHHMPHLLEAGDEVEYSIHIRGGFQVKKFGVNLIYENDKKDCHSYFEAMVKNASHPDKDDFLDEDKFRFDDKKKGIATSLDASKQTTQQQWDEELSAHLQDNEDVSNAQHCELTATILEDPTVVPEDHSVLVEVEDGLSEGDRERSWSDFHENQPGTMVFEGGAPFELNMYSSGIPRMNFVSLTKRLRSLELANAALERENFRLNMELANAWQFAPQLHMGLPRPHLAFERASSSASASIQPTIAATTPEASARTNTPGLDYPNFLARPVLGFQSVDNPSGSSPPEGGSHLPQ